MKVTFSLDTQNERPKCVSLTSGQMRINKTNEIQPLLKSSSLFYILPKTDLKERSTAGSLPATAAMAVATFAIIPTSAVYSFENSVKKHEVKHYTKFNMAAKRMFLQTKSLRTDRLMCTYCPLSPNSVITHSVDSVNTCMNEQLFIYFLFPHSHSGHRVLLLNTAASVQYHISYSRPTVCTDTHTQLQRCTMI